MLFLRSKVHGQDNLYGRWKITFVAGFLLLFNEKTFRSKEMCGKTNTRFLRKLIRILVLQKRFVSHE